MNKFFKHGLIQLKQDHYLNLLIILAPCLNFLSGLNIDLYAPSLPAIANYYAVSAAVAKNTITITLMGIALGCIIFGTLMDLFGRRKIILIGLTIYIIASLSALICHTMEQFMVMRFIQGVMIASIAIGSRTLIVDNFSGHRYNIGIMYTSIAYGLGPIIGPFIGGLIQYYLGWKANFIAYGLTALVLISLFSLFVNEIFVPTQQKFSLKNTINAYNNIIKHTGFVAGVCILGVCQAEQLLYPGVGPFLVETVLKETPIVYGNTALIVGLGYLTGTLLNRF